MNPTAAADVKGGIEEHVRATQDVLGRTDFEAVGCFIDKLHEAYQQGKKVFILVKMTMMATNPR